MSLIIGIIFLAVITNIVIDAFWYGSKAKNSVLMSLCYAFALFCISTFLVRESPAVRDSLLGTFAAFCFVMALRFVKRAFEIKRKDFESKGNNQEH